jgi:proteasome accessory factor C
VHRTLADAGSLTDGVFETPFSRVEPLAGWVLRQNGRAIPLEPKALRDAVAEGLTRLREGHDGESPVLARERRVEAPSDRGDRPVGPIAPERFGVLQALLAHVLSACGEGRDARLDADDLAERFSIPREELQETLSLLNLVNFGGGCYTVYAEVDEDAGIVRVDKELYGDVFRRPPRLTPLEARAISLAIDYVGPTIAAESHTTLDRVRKKLEETFGQFDLPQTLSGDAGDAEEQLVRTLSDAVEKRCVVEIEYLKEGDETPTTRSVEPYSFVRELPVWRVHTWDRTADGPRTYRLDRMRSARLTEESFEPREAFDPSYLTEPRLARLWHSPVVARWKVEQRGGRLLTDKAALSELPFKTDEWLISEVLADAGETVVLEPADMRARIAARARALQQELGVTVRRKRPAARA